MSKKIASAPEALCRDIKFGSGAFMPQLEDGLDLAQSMIAAGENAGIETIALMTDMDQPLGNKAGNWLEIEETIEVLQGGGPDDLREVILAFAGQMMVMGGKADSVAEGRAKCEEHLCADGPAMQKFRQMVEAQGGDVRYVDDVSSGTMELAFRTAHTADVVAEEDGYIDRMDVSAND